jgi:hypothetical protein
VASESASAFANCTEKPAELYVATAEHDGSLLTGERLSVLKATGQRHPGGAFDDPSFFPGQRCQGGTNLGFAHEYVPVYESLTALEGDGIRLHPAGSAIR